VRELLRLSGLDERVRIEPTLDAAAQDSLEPEGGAHG
jgi:hypothetical protein